jgi:hypothetical protein
MLKTQNDTEVIIRVNVIGQSPTFHSTHFKMTDFQDESFHRYSNLLIKTRKQFKFLSKIPGY